MNLSRRSTEKELLDRDDIPFREIERNMQELDTINSRLGGHTITLAGFRRLLKSTDLPSKQPIPSEAFKENEENNSRDRERRINGKGLGALRVGEIGCGGGDNLAVIHRFCRKQNIPVTLIGIDWNPHCIAVASAKFPGADAEFITADYKTVEFAGNPPDILFSSLFCHHFGEEELVSMLQWMRENARAGFFINDLHRHFLAWSSIRLLTALFSKSRLVKNDAPLSVLRGFRRAEWEDLLRQAGITRYSLEWRWAFRWLIVYSPILSPYPLNRPD